MADQWKVVYDLSNGAIFNDLEHTQLYSPSTTPIPGFKITPFFDAENFRNSMIYRRSFNAILIRTYRRHTQQCHLELP